MLPGIRLVVGDGCVVISTHGLAVVMAFAAGTVLAVRRTHAPGFALVTAATVAVAGLAGARFLFHALRGPGTGLASIGGIVAGLLASWIAAMLAGRDPRAVLDAIAPAGLLALGVGRLGCFLAGCCFGRPTTLPWGVVFPALGAPPRHPVQLYAAAGDLALVAWLTVSRGPPGAVARRACAGFGLLRATLELWRDPAATSLLLGGWVTLPQVVGLALAALGVAAQQPCAPMGLRLCLARSRAGRARPTEEEPACPRRNP